MWSWGRGWGKMKEGRAGALVVADVYCLYEMTGAEINNKAKETETKQG